MDLNTLNLDPDPEFWPNLEPDHPGPDPGLPYVINFERKKIIKNNFIGKQ